MFVEETELLELRTGSAVISTENLYRIIELPKGRVVGELANIDELGMSIDDDLSVKAGNPWRVAVDYELLNILEQQCINLVDVAVQPIPKNCCRDCGAKLETKTNKRRTFLCGATYKRFRKTSMFFLEGSQTLNCRTGELERLHTIAAKSDLLRQVLLKAGVDIHADRYGWLVDSRPGNDQFLTVEPSQYAASA